MSVAECTQKKDGEDDKSQGHDQIPHRPIGDLLESFHLIMTCCTSGPFPLD